MNCKVFSPLQYFRNVWGLTVVLFFFFWNHVFNIFIKLCQYNFKQMPTGRPGPEIHKRNNLPNNKECQGALPLQLHHQWPRWYQSDHVNQITECLPHHQFSECSGQFQLLESVHWLKPTEAGQPVPPICWKYHPANQYKLLLEFIMIQLPTTLLPANHKAFQV